MNLTHLATRIVISFVLSVVLFLLAVPLLGLGSLAICASGVVPHMSVFETICTPAAVVVSFGQVNAPADYYYAVFYLSTIIATYISLRLFPSSLVVMPARRIGLGYVFLIASVIATVSVLLIHFFVV